MLTSFRPLPFRCTSLFQRLLFSSDVKMPREPINFSWVADNAAGFGFPHEKEEWEYLKDVANISHVITMCHDKPACAPLFPTISHYHFPVDDLSPASLPILQKAMKVFEDAESRQEKVGVHCQLGRGRAGTILACYLAKKNGWDADKAVSEIRRMRPKSIDSGQEEAVRRYVESIRDSM